MKSQAEIEVYLSRLVDMRENLLGRMQPYLDEDKSLIAMHNLATCIAYLTIRIKLLKWILGRNPEP